MSIGNKVGTKLLNIRLDKRLTQADVEAGTGIAREYLSKMEHPEKENGLKNPTIDTLAKLLKFYGYTFQRFFCEIGI